MPLCQSEHHQGVEPRTGRRRNSAAMAPRSQGLLCPRPIDARQQAPARVADIVTPRASLARWRSCSPHLSPAMCQAGSRRPRPTVDRSVPKGAVPRAEAQARRRQQCSNGSRQTHVRERWRAPAPTGLRGPPFVVESVGSSAYSVRLDCRETIVLRGCKASLNRRHSWAGGAIGRKRLYRQLLAGNEKREVAPPDMRRRHMDAGFPLSRIVESR